MSSGVSPSVAFLVGDCVLLLLYSAHTPAIRVICFAYIIASNFEYCGKRKFLHKCNIQRKNAMQVETKNCFEHF